MNFLFVFWGSFFDHMPDGPDYNPLEVIELHQNHHPGPPESKNKNYAAHSTQKQILNNFYHLGPFKHPPEARTW